MSLQQTEGQPARFECRIAGSSPLEVSWLKDGEPLKENDEYSMSFDDNTAVLTISRGEMKHSGEYTCVATNSVGTASCRAKLTLQGLCKFEMELFSSQISSLMHIYTCLLFQLTFRAKISSSL